jgi:AcrR family transcriptional regulator
MINRTNTKSRIEMAALGLFVDHGIIETTTKQIAQAVGLSDGALYRHFKSKDEIAQGLFERQHAALANAINAAQASYDHIDDKARAITEAYCVSADDDWTLFRYHQLNQQRFLAHFGDDVLNPVDVVRDVIDRAMAKGEIGRGDPDLLAAMALGVVLQAVTFKVFGRITAPLCDLKAVLSKGVIAVLHSNDE